MRRYSAIKFCGPRASASLPPLAVPPLAESTAACAAAVQLVEQQPRATVGHVQALAAAVIEPVLSTASSSAILPGRRR